MNRISLAILLIVAEAACHQGSLSGGFFAKPDVRYYAGETPPGWRVKHFRDNDIAYLSEDSPHLIGVNATCKDYEDAPLRVLTQHLLMGFTERHLVREETRNLEGREALFSRYRAKMDGVPRELMLVVMKKESCVYDFTYISPPDRFDEKLPVFEEIVNRFRTEPRT